MKITKLSIIYKVTFPNKKIYIGRTCKPISSRKSDHYSDANKKSKLLFHRALLKYKGTEIWEILHSNVLPDKVAQLEILEIKQNKSFMTENGYNMTTGGEGTFNHLVSKEERQRRSNAYTGVKLPPRSQEWKDNISKSKLKEKNPMYGKTPINKGKTIQEFTGKGYNKYLISRQKFSKKIIVTDASGTEIFCFCSYIQAANFFGYSTRSAIMRVLDKNILLNNFYLKTKVAE